MRLTARHLQSIGKMLDFYSQFNPSPLSIKKFIDFGLNASEEKSYIFLRKELPVRLANIMKEIALLPENLLRMPSVVAVNDWYMRSFQEIVEFEKMDMSPKTLEYFCSNLVTIRNRHSDVIETMAQGVLELKESHDVDHHTENSIQYFLDSFRFCWEEDETPGHLITECLAISNQRKECFGQETCRSEDVSSLKPSQILELIRTLELEALIFGGQLENAPGPKGNQYIGCIDPQCDIISVIKDAYENARFLCDSYYLDSPALIIDESTHHDLEPEHGIKMVYVPSHLYYMLFELFKNSMRAVMEYHACVDKYPPISVTVSKGKEDICLKMSDKGGGLPRSSMEHLFQYMYSTAPQPSKADAHTVPLAGYGCGLPISRLYARYFHGDIVILTCEGDGTDAVIYMKALSNEANELLPIFNKSASKFYRTTTPTGDWSNQSVIHMTGQRQMCVNQKKHQLPQGCQEVITGSGVI